MRITPQRKTYDLYVDATSASHCSNTIVNNTGSGDRPIEYFNYSVNLQNKVLSELILCDADNSNINNITVIGSAAKKNNAVIVILTDNSNLTNINSSNNWDGIYLFSSSNNNVLTNNTATSNYYGITLDYSSNNTIANNTATSNYDGITLYYSSNNNVLTNNTATSNYNGILLYSSSNNTLADNTANSNNYGIRLWSSSNNTLTNNNASSNSNGIYLHWYSNNNVLVNNTASLNNQYGIYLESSNNNIIYNNMFNNTANYNITNSNNTKWNTTKTAGTNIVGGPYLGGNYWAYPNGTGFSETCTDANSDGICDTNYTLASGNVDYLPLTTTIALITNCTTISSPGTYVLQNDIIDSGATKCIEITSSDVIFDGAGHTIDGNDTASTYGVYVYNFPALTNVTVKNLNVTDWYRGIYYHNAQYGSIVNNTATSNHDGIYLSSSSNNVLTNNTATSNYKGIHLSSSSNNTLTDNIANSNTFGIHLFSSSINTLTNNNANSNTQYGIRLDSSNNILTNNTANSNNWYGIYLQFSSNNTIYNNFFNNTNNAGFNAAGGNTWNTTKTAGTNIVGGPFLGGNAWYKPDGTGFSETCTDANSDGICDTNYTLASGNVDYLPLTTIAFITNCTTISSPGTYVLQNDIINSSATKCIEITSSDVTFDGAGYTIDGTDTANTYGVYVYNAAALTNVTVKNLIATDWYRGVYYWNAQNGRIENNNASSNNRGIYLYSSNNNNVSNNNANSNGEGIILYSSSNNTLADNTANSNNYGINLAFSSSNTLVNNTANSNIFGIYLGSSSNNTLTNNTAKENTYYDLSVYATSASHCSNTIVNNTGSGGRPILYYNSPATLQDRTVAELILCNADGSNITNVSVAGSASLDNNEVLLYFTDNSNLTEVNSSNNYYGFYFRYSDNNTITGSTGNSNRHSGVYIDYNSDGNIIANNTGSFSNNGGDGIYVRGDDNIIENNTISNNSDTGVDISNTGGTKIINNLIDRNGHGIYSEESWDTTIRGNSITNTTGEAIWLYDDDYDDQYNWVIEDNLIRNASEGIHFESYYLEYYNITIKNNTIEDAGYGIDINMDDEYAWSIFIIGNRINNITSDGIYYYNGDDSTIVNNTINGSGGRGVYLNYVWTTNISGNNVTYSNKGGVYLTGNSRYNTISGNNISYNNQGFNSEAGLYITSSPNNTITGNYISHNLEHGVYISSSNNNMIYNNYFDNTNNAYDDGNNTWNTTKTLGTNILGGPYMGGNYWSDYNGFDTDCDGIGDTMLPYSSSGNIMNGGDYLPLVLPQTLVNATNITNGSTVVVLQNCHLKVSATANTTGNATANFTGEVTYDTGTFAGPTIPPINSSNSDADKGVKYLNITNNTGLNNITRIRIELHYTNAEIQGLKESSLALYYWNGSRWLNTRSYIGTNMTPTGPTVYAAGVNTAGNYVYAEVDHFSVYGVGGSVATPSPPSRGGGGGISISTLGEEVLVVANSIDEALASDFLSYLESNNIDVTVVNATGFTDAAKVDNRQIIILGGPDAPEGIGSIVSDLLSDSEEAAVRAAGAQEMFVKYNVYTDRYSYDQAVIVVAGSDRGNTKAAASKYDEDVKTKVLG